MKRATWVVVAIAMLAATPAIGRAEEPTPSRPAPRTVGIGLGWEGTFDLGKPNVASLRVRLNDKTTIEPSIGFGFDQYRSYQSQSMNQTTKDWGGDVAVQLRRVLGRRGPADLVGIAMGSAGVTTEHSVDRVTASSARSTGESGRLAWGIGIELWPTFHTAVGASPHWSLSADVTSPIASVSSTQVTSDVPKQTTTSIGAGLELRPDARVMAHVYF